MTLEQKENLVKSWGFSLYVKGTYFRNAPQGFTEWWSETREDYIEFTDKAGNTTHDYRIDWSLFDAK